MAADLGFRPGVDEVFAEVLPADKDQAVADLQARGLTVAMAGPAVLMSISTIVVALNAQLLRRVQLTPDHAEAEHEEQRRHGALLRSGG